MYIEIKVQRFNQALHLESGRILENFDLAYAIFGNMNATKDNIILVFHAWTGSHFVVNTHDKKGWWNELIGAGKAIDTMRYCVLCINVLGSCFGSSGPMSHDINGEAYRLNFPMINISDVVKSQKQLLDLLGIKQLKAVIGGSMGGMQALIFARDYPKIAQHIIVLACTHATSPWTIAFNKIAIEAITSDQDFNNGFYNESKIRSKGLKGLKIARMVGHLSFLSFESMNQKFARRFVQNEGIYDIFGRFEVERYLDYNGNNFSKSFDPISFIYLAKMINNFDLSHGFNCLKDALNLMQDNIHLISFSSDILFLASEMYAMYELLLSLNKTCTYMEVKGNYGHDSFLVEHSKFATYIANILS